MRKLLSVDASHFRDLLEAPGAHNRVERSLDFLGTALKLVAGTPVASDFEKTKFTELQLVNSNNRQLSAEIKCLPFRIAFPRRKEPFDNFHRPDLVPESCMLVVLNDRILIIYKQPANVCTDKVLINETKYLNRNNDQSKFPGIAASPLLNVTGHQDVLSLHYFHRLNERSLEIIKEVKDEIGSVDNVVKAFLLSAVCNTIICIGVTYRRFTKNMPSAKDIMEVIAEIAAAEGGLNLKGEQLTEINDTSSRC
ncbi:uncharacterized protein [Drosophila virilis]|uniref:uncharacterized protein n=1 Tax=Drosophila virilis TaxID=7244 RepID=UPI0038B23407